MHIPETPESSTGSDLDRPPVGCEPRHRSLADVERKARVYLVVSMLVLGVGFAFGDAVAWTMTLGVVLGGVGFGLALMPARWHGHGIAVGYAVALGVLMLVP